MGSCLAMVPLDKLGLVAVVARRLEVGGQSALNRLRGHYCGVFWKLCCGRDGQSSG